MTKHRRTMAQRRRSWERELGWWWDRNKEGVAAGVMVSCFSCLLAVYFMWGLA